MKVKLFTHTDLDGVGCQVIANHFFGASNVSTTYCDYIEVDAKISQFFTSGEYKKFNRIFITDISVNEDTATVINDISVQWYDVIRLIDHHKTAFWLNKYKWAEVTSEYHDGTKTSGTDLLLGHLINTFPELDSTLESQLISFAEQVRRWDTWDWYNIHKDESPKQLNNLMYLIGRVKFAKRFSENADTKFNEGESLVLSIEDAKIESYIKKVSKTIIEKKIAGYKAGVVFAESYSSELGNKLAEMNLHLDFIAIVNPLNGSVSYRSIRDDLDLGKDVAALYGGGGHPKASGSGFDKRLNIKYINSIFDKPWYKRIFKR
ncbi:hypothetical protein [Paenibacillus illinoisensis]|uniref:DHH family phosphoesterase n=1 Tax=Paenibacillus illinoisensis TaxID=59845 RepID=UPI003018D0A9